MSGQVKQSWVHPASLCAMSFFDSCESPEPLAKPPAGVILRRQAEQQSAAILFLEMSRIWQLRMKRRSMNTWMKYLVSNKPMQGPKTPLLSRALQRTQAQSPATSAASALDFTLVSPTGGAGRYSAR